VKHSLVDDFRRRLDADTSRGRAHRVSLCCVADDHPHHAHSQAVLLEEGMGSVSAEVGSGSVGDSRRALLWS